MSYPVVSRRCRCKQMILILYTTRGKRLAINPEPKGAEAYKYRDWTRADELFAPSTKTSSGHQPHFLTCTAPRPPPKKKRYV